ncbi:efflux RND transporter periplasmic adaptor subunit [Antarcticirhabdus aurantiaca]|uniref:Efflux RND transporter periplasmic adaptor subunit n=1 Tax=Antarcticirhabdus aurantiaca TaxID=2606717 RepID=A0ACD4NRT6_9HYPH|nr:efflux RND transporter periplasmic adaptor subunit [Antarcticirhabdus aurantiaca]WAJ29639.1 efflux RND transporter periplasmic adaptor subunit [Jeongeuplla avenae]
MPNDAPRPARPRSLAKAAWARIVGALCLAGLMAGTAPLAAQEVAEPAAEARLPAVTVASAEEAEIQRRISVAGALLPRDEVLIFPEATGFVLTELNADVGDRVEAGAVLALLDERALRSQLAQAEADHAQAQASVAQARGEIASAQARQTQANQALQRAEQLRGTGTGTQATLDEALANRQTAEAAIQSAEAGLAVAQAQLQRAGANLDIARLNLANAEIRTPVAGIVSARNGQVGAVASSAGEPIFRIIRDGAVEAEVEVIETELGLIGAGDPAELTVAGLGRVEGTVRLIWPVVEPTSRLGRVRIALENREGLRPGLFASGWITTENRRGLTVPATAVITDAEGSYVLRVEDGVLERRPVTAGLIWQGRREIVEGLAPGDEVVARAGAFFGSGDRIRPTRDGAATPAREASEIVR